MPPAQAERLRSRVGQQLTLGVRPENLHVAGDADPAGLTFASKVEVIEQLGSEILLDVRVGDDSMVAAVDPTTRTKVQETLRLAINPERLHFFDARPRARSEGRDCDQIGCCPGPGYRLSGWRPRPA